MISLKFGNNIFTIFGLFTYASYILSSFVFAGYIENYLSFIPALLVPLCGNVFAENNLQHYLHLNFREIRPRFYSFGAVYGILIYAICLHFYGIPFHISTNIICKTICLSCGVGRIGCHYYGCCWGKQIYQKQQQEQDKPQPIIEFIKLWKIYPISYIDKDTLILRLYPHFAYKYFFPLQLIEATILIVIGSGLYIIEIVYGYDSAILNIIIYYTTRYILNTYRHNYVKGTKILDFIVAPLLISIYLYNNPLPSDIVYVGIVKQSENFINSSSLYYGFITAFIYGFHYKRLGYWYNS
jgi:hypothetical protein